MDKAEERRRLAGSSGRQGKVHLVLVADTGKAAVFCQLKTKNNLEGDWRSVAGQSRADSVNFTHEV